MKLRLLILALLLLTLPPTVEAQTVDMTTIADFRRGALISDLWAIGVAQGAMTAMDMFVVCPGKLSVGELKAYLLFTADPTLTVQAAVIGRYVKDGCGFRPTTTGRTKT